MGHSEFLAGPNVDPKRLLVEHLVRDIPDNACVLAYNASFEKMVLPALVPGMGYEGLEIRDGGMAMEGYFRKTY